MRPRSNLTLLRKLDKQILRFHYVNAADHVNTVKERRIHVCSCQSAIWKALWGTKISLEDEEYLVP